MKYLDDIFIIILLYSIFAIIHSLTASLKLKNYVKKNFPEFFPFYRITYVTISIITIALIWMIAPRPRLTFYDLKFPLDIIVFIFQIFSILGFVYTIRYLDWKEFMGISQVQRFFKNEFNQDYDVKNQLYIDGPYKYSRHPLYLYAILFLVFQPYMTLFFLTFGILSIIYFFVGSYFEEKRLTEIYGDEYLNYKKNVSMIFPLTFFSKLFRKK